MRTVSPQSRENLLARLAKESFNARLKKDVMQQSAVTCTPGYRFGQIRPVAQAAFRVLRAVTPS
jgi:hypothetical protein